MIRRVLLGGFSVAVLCFLVAPALVVVPISFSSASYLAFPPPGWSTRWYEEYFSSSIWLNATVVSGKVALLAMVIATACGVSAAYGLLRGRLSGRAVFLSVLLAPMVVPHVVTAVSLYGLFSDFHAIGAWTAVAIAHAVLAIPLVIAASAASVQTLDPQLQQAASGLGASNTRVVFTIVLPLLRPAILGSAVLAFITSFDELIVSMFVAGSNRTLPVQMFGSLRTEIDPTIGAVSTMLIGLTVIGLLVSLLLGFQVRNTKGRN